VTVLAAVRPLVQSVYDRILRPHLPRKLSVCRGDVLARTSRLLDSTDIRPDYEAALLDGIERAVAPGERVCIVGGGAGVSAVVAAQAGASTIIVYEASVVQAGIIRETAHLNEVDKQIVVSHARVGAIRHSYGMVGEPDVIAPADLPACDVLVLDCEGAEQDILSALSTQPRALVVETHGCFGSPTQEIHRLIEGGSYGYLVVSKERVNRDKDISVLVAVRDGRREPA